MKASIRSYTAILILAACTTAPTFSSDPNPTNRATQPTPRPDEWWTMRHKKINDRVKQKEVDLIFVGDSITQGWEGAGKEVWEKYYGKRNAVNLGISGDQTQHVLWRLANGNIDGINPKVAVVMIGTNNSNGDDFTAPEIAEGVLEIVKTLRTKLPDTKVLLLAIFPRGENPNPQREKLQVVNDLIQSAADQKTVYYQDIGDDFVTPEGKLTPEIMPDYLHLSQRGYEIWAKAIESTLQKLLEEKPKTEPHP